MVKGYKNKLKQVKAELGRTNLLRKLDHTFIKIGEKVNEKLVEENKLLKTQLDAALKAKQLYRVS